MPAYDPELPATLSPKVLTGLLREELGFDGMIVTDGIEMAAVSGAYGIGGASARAIAAGADAICVGGERADEATAIGVRDAIVDAVTEGLLPEERLADAARTGPRAGRLDRLRRQRPGARRRPPRPRPRPAAPSAVTRSSSAAVLPLTAAPHVVELAPEMNLAIDKGTPWGVGGTAGRAAARYHRDPAAPPARPPGRRSRTLLAGAAGRPLVVVVRDAHRHPWQGEALRHLLGARPDAVVVEMGLPEPLRPGRRAHRHVRLGLVCGRAAAEVITGSL